MEENNRPPVLTKQDNARRWALGEFGNKIPSWPSIKAFCDDPALPNDTFTLRSYKPGSPFCTYNLTAHDVVSKAATFAALHGADPDEFYVNSTATNDEKLTLQAECCRSHRGLELRYSRVPLKMRDALAQEELNAHGIVALEILRHLMDATSFDWLHHLLDTYPDHVVEFSVWSCSMGDLGWNTIFWEVRKY